MITDCFRHRYWRWSPSQPLLDGTAILFGVCFVSVILYQFFIFHRHMPGHYLSGFADDFFYYAQVARNIAHTGHSTFDTISPTNGYQPFWLVFLTLVATVFDPGEMPFFVVVAVSSAILCAYGAYAFWKILNLLAERDHLRPATGFIALVYFLFAYQISRRGMEVALVFAFFPNFLWSFIALSETPTSRRAFMAGLWSAVLLLSRLDSVIIILCLVPAVGFAVIRKSSIGTLPRLVLAGLAGGLPFFVYLAINLRYFGMLMPISGAAKGLRDHYSIASKMWRSFLPPFSVGDPPISVGGCLLVLGGLAVGSTGLRHASERRLILLALLASVPVFYIATAIRSDWGLWEWYSYPIILSVPISLLIISDRMPWATKPLPLFLATVAAGVVFAGYSALKVHSRGPEHNDLLRAAQKLAGFAETHPGRYAMGDRAGIVGFLLPYPVLQLEGLVSDERTLQAIKARSDLKTFLQSRSINYYIATNPRPEAGCWRTTEPQGAGPSAPRMTGLFCGTPVFTFTLGKVVTSVFQP